MRPPLTASCLYQMWPRSTGGAGEGAARIFGPPGRACLLPSSARPTPQVTFSNGAPKFSPKKVWCDAKGAGAWALSLLW